MRKLTLFPLGIPLLAACVWASAPLGSVSSSQPFELNGATVSVAGIPAWPVKAGDVIVTHSAPATIVFHDGRRFVMAENTRLKIEVDKHKRPLLTLLAGTGKYIVLGGAAAAASAVVAPQGADNDQPAGKPPSPSPSK
jgi:hypothetical protein